MGLHRRRLVGATIRPAGAEPDAFQHVRGWIDKPFEGKAFVFLDWSAAWYKALGWRVM